MTRAPVVKMPSAQRAGELKAWIENPENLSKIIEVFNSTSRFGKLLSVREHFWENKINLNVLFLGQSGNSRTYSLYKI